jgi:hypothetical protein
MPGLFHPDTRETFPDFADQNNVLHLLAHFDEIDECNLFCEKHEQPRISPLHGIEIG